MREGTPKRVQNDVNMGAVLKERHVLHRHNARNHALVAMASGHLVARLDFPLHGDEDLDHLHHAGWQFIAALQLLDLVKEARFKTLLGFVVLQLHGFELGNRFLG